MTTVGDNKKFIILNVHNKTVTTLPYLNQEVHFLGVFYL